MILLRPARRVLTLGLSAMLAISITACGVPTRSDTDSGSGTGTGAKDTGLGTSDGDKKVTILGAFGGDEQSLFNASLAAFEAESGIDIQYTSDQDFTTTIKQKVGSGDAPDIGLFPQPGGLLELAAKGNLAPIDEYLDLNQLNSTLIPGFLDSVKVDGKTWGAPMRMAVKSIVWYSKDNFKGNTKPGTIQELDAEAQKIAATGTTPWCMGWGSDQATGWVGTDWIEELVLRMYGPEVYDEWTSHKIPFNDERIVKAFDEFAKIAKDPKMVYGGTKGILNTPFGDTMNPAFDTPPKCDLMRQGNFITGFLPKPVQKDLDSEVGTFVFPKYEGGYDGTPVLGGGDMAALFNSNDEDAKKVMQFLSSDKFGVEWAKGGGWLSPHKTFDAASYPNETTKSIAKLASDATVFRFDGSDLMPKEVGSGTFWTSMVKWVQGDDSKTATDAIEKSWPTT